MRVVILGAGGHGRAVADLCRETEAFVVIGFTDPAVAGPVLGLPVLGDDAEAVTAFREGRSDAAVVGIGNTALEARRRLFDHLVAAGVPTPAVVHPRAVIARSAALGAAAVVFAGAIVGAGARLGDNVVLYSGAVVEHDCRVERHAYLGPGVVLAGSVTVRESAMLGAGAIVLPGVEIGRGARVGAGAVVTAGVADGLTVAGVPARPIGA
jgi:sugar O-acyltransferase (sialic acid O-acetyltransferase NeuD family)